MPEVDAVGGPSAGAASGPARMFQVVKEGDPRLEAIARRVARTVELAAEKAVAHEADPERHPMPAGADSLEALFLARLRQQPPARRLRTVDRMRTRLQAGSQARSARPGEPAAADLRSAVPIAEQVDRLAPGAAVRLTAQDLTELVQRMGAEFVAAGGDAPLRATPES